jgi:hypothetical protein
MSGARVAWIIWCLGWAAFWLAVTVPAGGFSTRAALTTVVLSGASILAALLPVGAVPSRR